MFKSLILSGILASTMISASPAYQGITAENTQTSISKNKKIEVKSEDKKYFTVADAPLYKGEIAQINNTKFGTDLLVNKSNGSNSTHESLIFHIGKDTKINVDIKNLKVGDSVDIFHSLAMTNSLPGQTAAIAVNVVAKENNYLTVADAPLYKGQVQEIRKTEQGMDLLVNKTNESNATYKSLIFHIDKDTKINMENENLKVGSKVDIFYSGLVTRSLPGQTTAVAVNILK